MFGSSNSGQFEFFGILGSLEDSHERGLPCLCVGIALGVESVDARRLLVSQARKEIRLSICVGFAFAWANIRRPLRCKLLHEGIHRAIFTPGLSVDVKCSVGGQFPS